LMDPGLLSAVLTCLLFFAFGSLPSFQLLSCGAASVSFRMGEIE
jgi:hypothetical protein